MVERQFKNCHFGINPEGRYCETVFSDGRKVPAIPHDTASYKDFATGLGYADVWDMCREHEFLHTWLYEKIGRPYSPTLWSVAHPESEDVPLEQQWVEESVVLAFQKHMNTGEVDKPLADFMATHGLDLGTIRQEFMDLR